MWEIVIPAVSALAGTTLGLVFQPWIERQRLRSEREAEDQRHQAERIEKVTAQCLNDIADAVDECRPLSESTFTVGTAEQYARAEEHFHAAWHRAWAAYPGIGDRQILDLIETAYTTAAKWVRAEYDLVINEGKAKNENPTPTEAMSNLVWAAQAHTRKALSNTRQMEKEARDNAP
ncbi:hypothetical protein [Brevibacterium sp. FAM 24630]|uniref:hypothetical protein n=1 Tax=Brevibacterium sp. FAM 24630 TaxID=3415680 RepID=UPI003C7DE4D3